MKLPEEYLAMEREVFGKLTRKELPHLAGQVIWETDLSRDIIFEARECKGGVKIVFGLVIEARPEFFRAVKAAVQAAKEILEGRTRATALSVGKIRVHGAHLYASLSFMGEDEVREGILEESPNSILPGDWSGVEVKEMN